MHYNISKSSSALFFALVFIALLFLIPTSRTASAVSSLTGIIIPLYSYPGTSWDAITKTKQAHPSVPVVAVINPNSGPGDHKDTNFVTGIQKLQSAGVVVLGYVYTGNTPSNAVMAYIDDYKKWYNVNGIFFDQMSYVAGKEAYYQNLTNYAKTDGFAFTVGNPGTDTIPSYIGTVNNIVIYDNPALPTIQSLAGWHTNYTKNNFSIISYGINNLDQSFISNATKYVGYLYLSNQTLPNPFNSLPSYFDNLVSLLDPPKQQNTTVPISLTIKSADILGNPISDLWVEIHSSNGTTIKTGFTPLSYTVNSGAVYTVVISDFKNDTFNHWDNGNTNHAIIITPAKNTTLTAYYKTNAVPAEGFSKITCTPGYNYVQMTGQYTAGNTTYSVIFLRMSLLDDNGNIITTGTGIVNGVGAYKTTTFNAIARTDTSFSSCIVQIDKAIPK